MSPKGLVYRRGDYLAVLGDDSSYWLCCANQHVYEATDEFNIQWMEKTGDGNDLTYTKQKTLNRVPADSVLKKIKLFRSKTNSGEYDLPAKEDLALQKLLIEKKNSESIRDELEPESSTDEPKPKQRKKKRKAEVTKDEEPSTPKKRKNNKGESVSKIKVKKEKEPKPKKEKKVKVKKPPVDKSDPNWRLKPKSDLQVWEKDPLFETKFADAAVPFVSSTAHSRLAITAVLTKDMGLLKRCIEDRKHVHSLDIQRSVALRLSAMHYAIKENNLAAIKSLAAESKKINKEPRVGAPRCYLKTFGTGQYNYRSLGIKKIRRLNMSRGGREGNNALTKDSNERMTNPDLVNFAFSVNAPKKTLDEMVSLKIIHDYELSNHVSSAIRSGNCELAAYIIEKDMKRNGIGSSFSRFHIEALVGDPSSKWTNTVREASVRKKCDSGGLTPLHCAAINPNTKAFELLFAVVPDIHMADNYQRKLVHYAAACYSSGPLKFLSQRGANLEDVDREGVTPLMVACSLGRVENIKFIIETLKSGNVQVSTKMGIGGIDRPQKNSWRPLHLAAAEGKHEVAKYLLEVGAVADSQLNTIFDKMTPLMLAAANGDLEMVKILSTKSKIEKTDRYRRTALTHATMNGSASVASYLLARGSDPNRTDTSGNTNLHYATAYGWYFCLMALMKAGARLDLLNEWKLSPLAVAYLKGHIGIAKYLLDQPGVNINEVNDQGNTILLSMMDEGSSKSIDEEFVAQIEELIDSKGANPTLVNNSGQGVLHYLARYNNSIQNELQYPNNDKEVKKNVKNIQAKIKLINNLLLKFLRCGCKTFTMSKDGEWPLDAFLSNKICGIVPNFEAIHIILDDMKKNVETLGPIDIDRETLPKILISFVDSLSLAFVDHFKSIFDKLCEILKSYPAIFSTYCDASESSALSPLIKLCQKYSSQKRVTKSLVNQTRKDFQFLYDGIAFKGNNDEALLARWSDHWETFRSMIKKFIKTLKPKLFYEVPVNKEGTKTRVVSAAIAILGHDTSDEPEDEVSGHMRPGFQMLCGLGGEVEGRDENGKTRLVSAVQSGEIKTVSVLIDAGANLDTVFASYEEKHTFKENGKDKEIFLKSYPVYEAVKLCQLEILELLLRNKAKTRSQDAEAYENGLVVQRSPLLCAVRLAAKDRKNRKRYGIIRALASNGEYPSLSCCEKSGNNPLHIAVNGSSDNADQSLELETTLFKNGCDVFAVNNLKRIPLHYAFVKESNDHNCSAIDPVEVVALLLEAMNGTRVDEPDAFGCTPMHYAAFRGATVSCLLLLQKGANINAVDHAGNTPVAYAVLGNHSGCTLMLLQKDAKINCDVHTKHHEKEDKHKKVKKQKSVFLFTKEQYESKYSTDGEDKTNFSLFRGIVQNAWLGITYVALDRMERFGFSYARAIEVAFAVEKFQFAKTLIERQTSVEKLRTVINDENGSLFHAFADNCKHPQSVQSELLEEIFDLLKEAGVSPSQKDARKRSTLHYACQNENIVIIKQLLQVLSIEELNYFDATGQTPVSILFSKSGQPNEETVKLLVGKGADLNILSNFQLLDHFRRGYDPDVKKRSQKTTPLIVSIVHVNLEMTKLLLELGADINQVDGDGLSPLIHAVRTNSIEMVKTLLKFHHVDLAARDANGFDVFDHIAAFGIFDASSPTSTYDNIAMLDLLLNTGAKPSAAALNRAKEAGATKIAAKLARMMGINMTPYKPAERQDPEVDLPVSDYDVVEDAREMLKIFEAEAEKEAKKKPKKDDDDDDDELKKHVGCNVSDGEIWNGYALLMTKIDVAFGAWGLYNYYRMEIWKEKYKELYILFTNWGRIGDFGGQYQNTPFATAKQAEEEFQKIFKAKSGNIWSERENFEVKPKRYRLVTEVKRKKMPPIKFDLTTDLQCQCPKEVQEMLSDITNVPMYTKSYKDLYFDDETVPFGQIKKDEVEKAKKILEQIEPLIKERAKIDQSRMKGNTPALDEKLFQVLDKIYSLSTEFYYLMPKKGFEFTRLSPIDAEYIYDQEVDRIRNLLEFETVARFLLGAQFRKHEIHPMDYIYKAMGCRIQPLKETSEEVPFILKYMYNSNGAHEFTVESIYKVHIPTDVKKQSKLKDSIDHQLLWHGTKSDSLVSILMNGLLINPPSKSALRTGRSFGDGIYTANVFDKSIAYTEGRNNGSKYLLLCDVAPGKMKTLKTWESFNEYPPKGFDSVHVFSQHGPAAEDNVRLATSGLTIPVGKLKARENCFPSQYDEFIVYDEKHVTIRYVIKIISNSYVPLPDTSSFPSPSNGRGWGGSGRGLGGLGLGWKPRPKRRKILK